MFALLPMGFRTLSKLRQMSYGRTHQTRHQIRHPSLYNYPYNHSYKSNHTLTKQGKAVLQNPAYGYRVTGWQVEKQGNLPQECEDVWLHEQGVIALADGATETSFAQEWAQHLVTSLASDPWGGGMVIPEKMPDWQRYWHHWLEGQDLSWFARRKAQQGTAATILALRFDHTGAWQALAVGDSCLFGVRRDPSTNADYCFLQLPKLNEPEFTTRPPLVHSHYPLSPMQLQYARGYAQGGDRFYLMSDALALWWVQQMALGQKPWQTFDQMNDGTEFRNWVEEQRQPPVILPGHQQLPPPPHLHNDDTTLIQIQMLGQDVFG